MQVVINDQFDIPLKFSKFGNEDFLKISHYDKMRSFFMSIVSDSDHWMFISSNGGLSAGRKNAEYALFPYYTDDKITELSDITGSKSIFQIENDQEILIWEPFSDRFQDKYRLERNLYKSIYGNKIIFEEINQDLNLIFRYSWNSSNQFGFIKKSEIYNIGNETKNICILDGIQNVLPFGVSSDLQNASSNLVDAYKRTELHKPTGLGIFALSAIIVDKAEPSEALKANVVWSLGLEEPTHLLSSKQLNHFRNAGTLIPEYDVKAEKGAYFVSKNINLQSEQNTCWKIIADVNKNHSQVVKLCDEISNNSQLDDRIEANIKEGTERLIQLAASADGLQYTNDMFQDCRHYSNVLFNIMRGGIFDENYWIEIIDFEKYLKKANKDLYPKHIDFIKTWNDKIPFQELYGKILKTGDTDLIRLTIEYLPLKFSRRHGDPSRPWNRFSINLRNEKDDSKILDYEGNWRDIFQNWEALAWSFPEFIDGMIFKFLNASTFDGYNPYRVTKDGFDWEVIEPDDPWSYIGYWGDHQIIYLQKFLEIIEKFKPGKLSEFIHEDWFVYAAVPYIIKPYENLVQYPKDTIEFDNDWDRQIREKRTLLGADGALLTDSSGDIYHVNFIEKILATLLAKLSNFIPEGGIWMNTQRPEWNDANNALVGNGVSMVTLYYLRRCIHFLIQNLENTELNHFKISSELVEFYHSVRSVFDSHIQLLEGDINDAVRKEILDSLGKAGSDYRTHIYQSGFWGKKRSISKEGMLRFLTLSIRFIEHTIRNNQRSDKLFHAYNLMTYTEQGVHISHLDEMLEGQVAALSSQYLSTEEVIDVLDAMKASSLFRPDQYSYLLYPNKELPGFLNKNIIPKTDAMSSALIQKLVSEGNVDIVERDLTGQYHFNGDFKNATDLKAALERLKVTEFREDVIKEERMVLNIFEKVFNHKAFTGRSGTFYAYEGLGSIYWHMVSKLLLAVQECSLRAALENDESSLGRMLDHYYEIQAGIGVHKSPKLYGAFPTDPYSHTPMHKGAQQPGMTGQVKEDILSRIGEVGVVVDKGQIHFVPRLLRSSEFLKTSRTARYFNLNAEKTSIDLQPGQLSFIFCQVPVVYELADHSTIYIFYSNGQSEEVEGHALNSAISKKVFGRTGEIYKLHVMVNQSILK
jgi:hypothetical protein